MLAVLIPTSTPNPTTFTGAALPDRRPGAISLGSATVPPGLLNVTGSTGRGCFVAHAILAGAGNVFVR